MRLVVCLLSLMSLSLIARANEDISLYTENFKPFQYLDGDRKLAGFGVDLVTTMFERANLNINNEIRMAVWSKAYDQVLKTPDSAIFMTVRNKKRENLFKWVGPLAPRKMWLYKLSSRKDIVVNTLEDAKKYIVGTYQSAQSDYLKELNFPKLDIILKEELNIKKLLAGRIDLMPSSEILMVHKIKDLRIKHDEVKKVIVFDDRFDYYLALNKQTSDTKVTLLQVALDQIKADGTYEAIENQYLRSN